MTLPQILWVEQDSAYLPANGIDRSSGSSSFGKHVRVDKTFVVHAPAEKLSAPSAPERDPISDLQ